MTTTFYLYESDDFCNHTLYDSLESMQRDREDKDGRNRTKRASVVKLTRNDNAHSHKLDVCGEWEYDDGVLYEKTIKDKAHRTDNHPMTTSSSPLSSSSLFIVKDYHDDGFGIRSYMYSWYNTLGGMTEIVKTHEPPVDVDDSGVFPSADHPSAFVSTMYIAEFKKTECDGKHECIGGIYACSEPEACNDSGTVDREPV